MDPQWCMSDTQMVRLAFLSCPAIRLNFEADHLQMFLEESERPVHFDKIYSSFSKSQLCYWLKSVLVPGAGFSCRLHQSRRFCLDWKLIKELQKQRMGKGEFLSQSASFNMTWALKKKAGNWRYRVKTRNNCEKQRWQALVLFWLNWMQREQSCADIQDLIRPKDWGLGVGISTRTNSGIN